MGQKAAILKPWQRKAIRFLAGEPAHKAFYLTGGTALAAYYLKHRFSDDLDFFTAQPVDSFAIHDLAARLKDQLGASSMRFSKIHDRYQFFYPRGDYEYKIEFTHFPFKQLKPGKSHEGIAVDSEYDIAVNKLSAMLERFEPKDFVDLYFLLPRFSLVKLANGAEKKFGITVDALFLGSELLKVRRIAALPKMIQSLTIEELKSYFEEEAKKLSKKVVE